jgi:outer membrane protein OmpA-like peptidoglycan-associated protein
MLGRYEGSKITSYVEKGYEEFQMLTAIPDNEDKSKKTSRNSTAVSGKYWRITYEGPPNRSALEVVRNLEKGLSSKGFESLLFCKTTECGGSGLWMAITGGGGKIVSNWDTSVYSVQKLSRPVEGDVWISMLAVEMKRGSELIPQLLVDIVEANPMETEKVVFVDATKMEQDISDSGKVSIYGILFDLDKADIKPDSKATLDEVSKLLKSQPGLNLVVSGHTDNQGTFDYNLSLSQRRAESVVSALVNEYGISRERLIPFGVGMASPVASNETEAGRARNRRVELVKR